MSDMETNELSQLGRAVEAALSPEEAVRERVANPHRDDDYLIRFTCPEFTPSVP